jgi:hypothetical protein
MMSCIDRRVGFELRVLDWALAGLSSVDVVHPPVVVAVPGQNICPAAAQPVVREEKWKETKDRKKR